MENGIAAVLPLAESNPMPIVPVTTPRTTQTLSSTRVLRLITAIADLRRLKDRFRSFANGSARVNATASNPRISSYIITLVLTNSTVHQQTNSSALGHKNSEPKCPRTLQTSADEKGSRFF